MDVSTLATIDANGKPVDSTTDKGGPDGPNTPSAPNGSPDDGDGQNLAVRVDPAPGPNLTTNPIIVKKVGF